MVITHDQSHFQTRNNEIRFQHWFFFINNNECESEICRGNNHRPKIYLDFIRNFFLTTLQSRLTSNIRFRVAPLQAHRLFAVLHTRAVLEYLTNLQLIVQ